MFEDFWKINTEHYTLYIVLATIVLSWLLMGQVSRFISTLLLKLIKSTGRQINESAYFNLLVKPLERFLLWFTIMAAIDKLYLSAAFRSSAIYGDIKVEALLSLISASVITFTFCKLLISIIEYIAHVLEQKANLTRSQGDNQLIVFFKDFLKVLVIIIGVLLVLKFGFGVDIGNVLTGLSIVGAAIALATKESIENLIASFIIFFDQPFTTGDEVKVQTVSGTVERIGLRSTRIRTADKTYVSVPNKLMVDSIVDNFSLRTLRRAIVSLELDNTVAAEEVNEFKLNLEKFLAAQKELVGFKIYLSDFIKNAIVVKVELSYDAETNFEHFTDLKERVQFEILKLLSENKIALSRVSV